MAAQSEILQTALDLISHDRNDSYGDAFEDFSTVASFWSDYIAAKHGIRVELQAADVALMMALLKIRRQANLHKPDNLIDACGYIALAGYCEEVSK